MRRMGALDSANAAYAEKRWAEAFTQLTDAESRGELTATDLEHLAVASHCLGKNDESTDAWSRAYNAYLQDGDIEHAALAAAWCSFGLLTRGEFALGSGWLSRAQTLCEEHNHDGPATWFILGQTAAGIMMSGDFATALPMFEKAQRNVDRLRDPSGMALSRLGRGQCLAHLGRAPEGLSLLDDVMVAVTNDDISPMVAGLAFCAAIETCHEVLDVRRAQEWTAALTRWCDEQPTLVPYRGDCLVHRAEILALHGAWPEAQDQAERARDWLTDIQGMTLGSAYYQLGELHRLRGEYAHAETAYKQASQHGHETQPGLGLLRLAQGHVDSATAAIRRALDETSDVIPRAHLLGAYAEVALAAADIAAARASADELTAIAAQIDAPLLTAKALHVHGAVALAEGDPRMALGVLRQAWIIWQDLDAPYDGARARALIGQACRALDDGDTAEMEFDAARWVFQELGAATDLAAVAKLAQREPPAAPGGLSLREVQVLRLVAAGKTNRTIAGDLFLSEKTVERHLSNIFTKINVSSRSAATAYAFNHDLV
ncbi:MAG: hypothetical protein QOG53_208 [Frankiales bacterium]|jgi:DNA-binding CsgD family transcriptional regulator/tetratricopeptide (TPR) repeat protein|nr:hypothetical protein [Frankiales bacterium]